MIEETELEGLAIRAEVYSKHPSSSQVEKITFGTLALACRGALKALRDAQDGP